MDRWSAGTLENSILNAYLHTIRESRHFLYIEVCRSEGGAEKLRISCQWAQSFRAGIAGPGELGEAWTQGREPGDGDGDMELRAGTADGGAGLLTSVIGPCSRISSSLAAQMGGRC